MEHSHVKHERHISYYIYLTIVKLIKIEEKWEEIPARRGIKLFLKLRLKLPQSNI